MCEKYPLSDAMSIFRSFGFRCELTLIFEMGGDLGGGFGADKRVQLLDRCFCDAFDRAEMAEQLHLSLYADHRYLGQL